MWIPSYRTTTAQTRAAPFALHEERLGLPACLPAVPSSFLTSLPGATRGLAVRPAASPLLSLGQSPILTYSHIVSPLPLPRVPLQLARPVHANSHASLLLLLLPSRIPPRPASLSPPPLLLHHHILRLPAGRPRHGARHPPHHLLRRVLALARRGAVGGVGGFLGEGVLGAGFARGGCCSGGGNGGAGGAVLAGHPREALFGFAEFGLEVFEFGLPGGDFLFPVWAGG